MADEAPGASRLLVPIGRGARPRHARRAAVCLLARGAARARLERVPPATLADALARDLDPGFDRFPERHDVVVRALGAGGGWRLTLSHDPREALPLLREMLADVEGLP